MSCCDPATSMWHNVWMFLIAAILFFHAHFVNARLADIERAIREARIEVREVKP